MFKGGSPSGSTLLTKVAHGACTKLCGTCPRLHQTMRRLPSNGDKPSNGGMGINPRIEKISAGGEGGFD